MKNISVFVVDDHKLVREMWSELISKNTGIEVIGESGELEDAIKKIKEKRPDVVLLDINLSTASGFDAVPLIRKFAPASEIIIVSMHCQPAYAKKMFQLGAKGYVTKNSSHKEMLVAIKEVMAGRKYVCEEIRNIISDNMLNDEPGSGLEKLSLREIEVIKLIKEGQSSKEMASVLEISVRTAEVHRHNILKKLQLKNTAALINFISKTVLTF